MTENIRSGIFTLAKVMIAAAWADGEITEDEKQCLKDLLFHLPDVGLDAGIQMTANEWTMLEMYMDTPIEAEERTRLVAELQETIQDPDDKLIVVGYLEEIATADGDESAEERQVIDQIEAAMEGSHDGVMDRLNRFLGGAMGRRSQAVASGPNREQYFDDFVRNKVYYEVTQQLEAKGRQLDISDVEMRKLGLAGGLMARIAQVDETVTDDELAAMASVLETHWQLDQETAVFVANVAVSSLDVSYDYYRMTREFGTSTTREERLAFVNVLFNIAVADGGVSYDETEEIRLVARSVNLTHEDFIDAKLRIPRDKRSS